MKKMISTLLGSSLLLVAALASAEGDILRGAEKVKQVCAACHDASGISKSPMFPILAGQYDDYLREALHAYKRGDRKDVTMKGQAAALSDQDIEDVSAYYSQQPAGLKTAH